jgi:hypothetical protein
VRRPSYAWADEIAYLAQVIPFADDNSAMSKDIVGGHDVEVEVRQHPCLEKLQAIHCDHHLTRERDAAIAILCPFERSGTGSLQVFHRRSDEALQTINSRLIFGVRLRTFPSDAKHRHQRGGRPVVSVSRE